MAKLRKNVTYLIDANNYVCRKYRVVPPPCEYSNDFLEKIDGWVEREIAENNRHPEVFIVFDGGAKECTLTSKYAKVIIAPNRIKADHIIFEKAHEIRDTNLNRVIRIISDEKDNEFATLREEDFELYDNDYLAERINHKVDKEDIDYRYLNEELKSLFKITDDNVEEKKNKTPPKPPPKFYDYILKLHDECLETRLSAITALRDFPNDSVILHLKIHLEKEENSEVKKHILDVLLHFSSKYEIGQVYLGILLRALDRILARETNNDIRTSVIMLKDKLVS